MSQLPVSRISPWRKIPLPSIPPSGPSRPPPSRRRRCPRRGTGRSCSSSSNIRPRGCTTTSGSNATASSNRGPCPRVRRSIAAKSALPCETEDHPYDYASFEGVIPAGQYGAGEVIVWDCGVYSPDEGGATWFHDRERAEREVRDGLANGKLSVLLRGEKLKGSFALVRTKEKNQWLHDQAQGPVRGVRRRHGAEPFGAFRQDGRGAQVPSRRAHPRHATRARGQARTDAREARADAGRSRRCAVPSRGLDVGAQARRLSRARLHRRAGRQAPLAARARARTPVSATRRRALPAGRG